MSGSSGVTEERGEKACRWWRGGHAWNRWEVVKINLRSAGSVVDMQDRQRRSCLRCGLTEERLLSRGLIDNGSGRDR